MYAQLNEQATLDSSIQKTGTEILQRISKKYVRQEIKYWIWAADQIFTMDIAQVEGQSGLVYAADFRGNADSGQKKSLHII